MKINGKTFTNIILFGKIGLLFFLSILGLVNYETRYIIAHPDYLIGDAYMVASVSAICAGLMFILHNNNKGIESSVLWHKGFESCFMVFLFFFFFAIIREFSGYFNFMANFSPKSTSDQLNQREAKENPAVFGISLTVALLFTIVVIYLAIVIREPITIPFWLFISEYVFVTVVISVVETMVSLRHEKDNKKGAAFFFTNFLLFTGVFFVLQYGGMNKELLELQNDKCLYNFPEKLHVY
uniref:Uncharacterized protein n=1 Tax=viral metagenome TaxID=1070528 RepID=A0A6C0CTQ5_9ZZZZ